MADIALTVDALKNLDHVVLDELPPYVEFSNGSDGFDIALIAGEEGEPGAVSSVRYKAGRGLRYADMPMASTTFITTGTLIVTSGDTTYEVSAGGGVYVPKGWSGTIEAKTDVATVLNVF